MRDRGVGRGQESFQKGWVGPGDQCKDLGGVGRAGEGRESHLDGW